MITRTHRMDGWLLRQQFKHRLKLIPKPKGTYNGMVKIMICPGGRLHWDGDYIRNYMVNTCQDLEDTCYEAFTQGRSTYAKKLVVRRAFAWRGRILKTCDLLKPISLRSTLDGMRHSPLVNYCRPVTVFVFPNSVQEIAISPHCAKRQVKMNAFYVYNNQWFTFRLLILCVGCKSVEGVSCI